MAKDVQNFFTEEQEKQIVAAIKGAEKNTSGEIRVHLDNSKNGNELEKAQAVFLELRMNETALRNGILFHISVYNKTFSVVADEGINEKVPQNFWDDIIAQMKADFSQAKFCEGLCKGIETSGYALKEYFPFMADDKNEISNEISKD